MKLSPRRPGGCRTTSPSGSQERFVGPEVVRALLGTLQDKQTARSVLVTTSWYGKTGWEIAHRNGQRPALIDGRNLKALLLEHLGLDALISLPTPARLAAGRCRTERPLSGHRHPRPRCCGITQGAPREPTGALRHLKCSVPTAAAGAHLPPMRVP